MHQNKIQELINYCESSNRRQGAKGKEANETKELWLRLKRKKIIPFLQRGVMVFLSSLDEG